MARIKSSSIEAVRGGADFIALVSERTSLSKSGTRLMGHCPFHQEHNPIHQEHTQSFAVNSNDKLYFCFDCGTGGDLITFVRKTQGLGFTGAVEWLGERFGIPIEYVETYDD